MHLSPLRWKRTNLASTEAQKLALLCSSNSEEHFPVLVLSKAILLKTLSLIEANDPKV
jgi:hypothetical protein